MTDANEVKIMRGIAVFAELEGFNPHKLLEELQGSSELARFCRHFVGLTLPQKKRGPRARVERNWEEFVHIELAREGGRSIEWAIREILKRKAVDDKDDKAFENMRQRYRRSKERWGRAEITLATLFGPPAEPGQGT